MLMKNPMTDGRLFARKSHLKRSILKSHGDVNRKKRRKKNTRKNTHKKRHEKKKRQRKKQEKKINGSLEFCKRRKRRVWYTARHGRIWPCSIHKKRYRPKWIDAMTRCYQAYEAGRVCDTGGKEILVIRAWRFSGKHQFAFQLNVTFSHWQINDRRFQNH